MTQEEILNLKNDVFDKYKKSSINVSESNFVKFLIKKFGNDIALTLVKEYEIGYSDIMSDDGVVFWYRDINNELQSGKVMNYDKETCKRIRYSQGYNARWVHNAGHEFNMCFFGEHLVKKYPEKKIIIVESEKTAIICSAYFPNSIWLACGGSGMLNEEKLSVLYDRTYIAYPDTDCIDKWSYICEVGRWYEEIIEDNEMAQGLDYADFLLNFTVDYIKQLYNESLNDKKESDYIEETVNNNIIVEQNIDKKIVESVVEDKQEVSQKDKQQLEKIIEESYKKDIQQSYKKDIQKLKIDWEEKIKPIEESSVIDDKIDMWKEWEISQNKKLEQEWAMVTKKVMEQDD